MHTKTTATTLWCPMTRAAVTSEAAENRERECDNNPEWSQCIADRCAMWRWVGPTWPDAGFCGLAGDIGLHK